MNSNKEEKIYKISTMFSRLFVAISCLLTTISFFFDLLNGFIEPIIGMLILIFSAYIIFKLRVELILSEDYVEFKHFEKSTKVLWSEIIRIEKSVWGLILYSSNEINNISVYRVFERFTEIQRIIKEKRPEMFID